MSTTLATGNLGCKINILREFDIELYLVPPVTELCDIEIQLQFPKVIEHDILISCIRELDLQLTKEFKKVDSLVGFILNSQSTINKQFTDLSFIDNSLSSIVNISNIIKVPHGTFDSIKAVPVKEQISIPVSENFVILDTKETDNIFPDILIDGMLFIKFKHSISSHPSNHDGLLTFFDIEKLQYISYVKGTDVPTNIDDYYSSYYIGYLYTPTPTTIKFGIDGDDACELEVDGIIVCSWYGGHGFSGDPSAHSGEIELQAGWHRLIVRHEEISGGDGVKAYIYDSINSAWRLLTVDNINTYFPELKLKVPFYKTKEEIIENLFKNPPLSINESLNDLIQNSSLVLLKALSNNKELVETLPTLKDKIPYKINILQGSSEGSDLSLLESGIMLNTSDGVSFIKDSDGNAPIVEFTLPNPEVLTDIYFFIAPTFNYTYYTYTGTVTMQFFSTLNDKDTIKAIPKLINTDNSINIQNYVYNSKTNQYEFSLIDQNQVTKITLQYKIPIQKIRFSFTDSIGTFRLFSILSKTKSVKLIDRGNKILQEINKNTIQGIHYSDINLKELKLANIPKDLFKIVDYIAFSKDLSSYKFKITNIPIVYTVNL